MNIKLFLDNSVHAVKSVDIPIKSVQSDLTVTYLVYDDITVSIKYEIFRDYEKVSCIEDQIEVLIDSFGCGKKPFCLESGLVYSSLKDTIKTICDSNIWNELVDQCPDKLHDLISTATELVEALVPYKSFLKDVDLEAISTSLDTTLIQFLDKFDQGVDNIRLSLAVSVKQLRLAINKKTGLFRDSSNSISVSFSKLQDIIQKFVSSLKEVWIVIGKLTDSKVNEYNDISKLFIIAKLKNDSLSNDSNWKSILFQASNQLALSSLNFAQPYVQYAVSKTTPTITSGVKYSKPYFKQLLSASYVQKVGSKVKEIVLNYETTAVAIDFVTVTSADLFQKSVAYAVPRELVPAYDNLFSLE